MFHESTTYFSISIEMLLSKNKKAEHSREEKQAFGIVFQSIRTDILLPSDVASNSFVVSTSDILLKKAVLSGYLVGVPQLKGCTF